MEALVGDMHDIDEGRITKDIQPLTEDSWRIKGSADIAEVSHTLGLDLMNEDLYDTFNGYVCDVLQRVPNDGEIFICETDDLTISVRTVKNHMVQSAIVTKKQKDGAVSQQ